MRNLAQVEHIHQKGKAFQESWKESHRDDQVVRKKHWSQEQVARFQGG